MDILYYREPLVHGAGATQTHDSPNRYCLKYITDYYFSDNSWHGFYKLLLLLLLHFVIYMARLDMERATIFLQVLQEVKWQVLPHL